MNKDYLNKIINGDCKEHLKKLETESIDLFLSDIPYGINLDEWDVLHKNTNSALLGESPAQKGKTGFKRRGKPINGWSSADRNSGKEYQEWCQSWSSLIFPIMKEGASVFVFGARRTLHRAINAFEDSGFLLKDVLAWKKPSAHHRAQRLSGILEKRGLKSEAEKWKGWRLGNLAPIYEPIAWFFKPYKITITDNILKNEVGALNIEECKINGTSPTNLLEFGFESVYDENKFHEAQKPVALLEFLITLTTTENQIILDPFMGSGTTAVAAKKLNRNFIGFEIDKNYTILANERVENVVQKNDIKIYSSKKSENGNLNLFYKS
ncbi:DNA-methyltransferase [Bernardetia sp.]|uniref:DNA-methyltransferase n=1 Tax=Bernardetia sp. TaxID=1937974 RepID=UPI0025C5D9EC|nr:site-specific DNA-methyltransferase [Bernardetia sp.]